MRPQLPRTRVLMLPGKHHWKLWKPAMCRVLKLAAPAADH